MDLSWTEAFCAIAIVALGTSVQASIGFGLAMITAPLLVLLSRDFVPGPLIAANLALGIWMALRERQALDLGNFKPAIAGRVLGTVPAALLVGTLSAAAFDLVFASLVILAVLVSLIHPHIRPTPKAVFWGMAASGFMGTISSISGPPLALVYQNARGAALRANMAALFVMGYGMSLLALVLVGDFRLAELGQSAVLLLGVALGAALSGRLKRLVDKRNVRPLLLALCLLSAALVLGRALLSF